MAEYIEREEARKQLFHLLIETANNNVGYQCDAGIVFQDAADRRLPPECNPLPQWEALDYQIPPRKKSDIFP